MRTSATQQCCQLTTRAGFGCAWTTLTSMWPSDRLDSVPDSPSRSVRAHLTPDIDQFKTEMLKHKEHNFKIFSELKAAEKKAEEA